MRLYLARWAFLACWAAYYNGSPRGRFSGRVGGAIGGIAGALIGMGISEYEANRYEGRVKDGGILLSIHCDDRNWTAKPNRSWYATGAQDVAYTGESAADWQKSDKPLPRAS